MNRKTTTILAVAGGLVAAAVALGHQSSQGATPDRRITGTPTPPTPPPVADLCSTEKPLPSKTSADFGRGTLNASLSSGKILRGSDGELYMAVDLAVNDAPGDKRADVNMAIVIDNSGSMAGDKIVKAREAARGIVERLGPNDRVALVQYDDTAQLLVPSIAMDKEGKARMFAAIERIQDDGGTNLHDGMMLGIGEAKKAMGGGRINRVVLMSDGQANVGVVDPQAIARAASNAADEGVRITTVGLGLDYNEDLMEAVADSGRGQYYYVKDAGTLEAVFAGELKSMQGTVATKAEIRLSPACSGVELVEVYGYESRRDGKDLIVPLADLAGGEKRKVLVKLRTPVEGNGARSVVRAALSFEDKAGGKKTATADLGVTVTDDAQAVKASVDTEVLAKVEQVEAARTMRQAAIAYDKGDVAGARGMIARQRRKSEERAQEYNLPAAPMKALDAEMGEMDDSIGRHAPGSAEGKAAAKGAKATSRELSK